MRCEKAKRLMAVNLDDRLDRARITELQEHLDTCDPCRAEWRRVSAVDQLFKSAPMVSAPVYLRGQIMARIDRREQARRAIVGSLALALGAIALTLLTLIPVALGLVENLGGAPALLIGGAQTAGQLVVVIDGLSRMLLVLLNQFVTPLALLGLVSIAAALTLNGLWIAAVRRLLVAG